LAPTVDQLSFEWHQRFPSQHRLSAHNRSVSIKMSGYASVMEHRAGQQASLILTPRLGAPRRQHQVLGGSRGVSRRFLPQQQGRQREGLFLVTSREGDPARTALKFLRERDEPRIPMLKQPHFGQSPGNPWWLTPSHKFSVDKQCLDGPSQRSHLSLCIHQPRSAQAERAWGSRDQCAGLILCKSLVSCLT